MFEHVTWNIELCTDGQKVNALDGVDFVDLVQVNGLLQVFLCKLVERIASFDFVGDVRSLIGAVFGLSQRQCTDAYCED